MAFRALGRFFQLRKNKKSRPARGNRVGAGLSLQFEPLETRQLLTVAPSVTYVDTQWNYAGTSSSLSLGDQINNLNDADPATIIANYGVNGFGTVTTGSETGSVSGASLIDNAIEATAPNGTVDVFPGPGPYSDSGINVDQPVTLQGSFTLASGSLCTTSTNAILSPSAINPSTAATTAGTITISSGNLNLDDGTLAVQVDSAGNHDEIDVNGTANLDGASLTVGYGYSNAHTGDSYTIINASAVSGTFAGLPNGATITLGEETLTISYSSTTAMLTVTALNPFASYVDGDWSGTTPGDTVTAAAGTISTTYGTVSPSSSGFNTEGFSAISTAVAATGTGGSVTVLPGTYTGNVDVTTHLALDGSYTLTGNLAVTGPQATLNTGPTAGTISVENLTLASGVGLTLKLDPTPANSDEIVASGAVDLGGATLTALLDSPSTSNITLISSGSGITGTFAGLPEGARVTLNSENFWITYRGGTSGDDVVLVAPSSTVAGRFLFYDNSKFSKNVEGVAGGTTDDKAIDTTKSAYLPGAGAATFANLSGYADGINGIMVDITGSHPNISANDFLFQVGTNNSPSSWTSAPAPTTVSVRAGAGTSGSDRVELTWADGAITEEWLRVTVVPTADTGLAAPDVFYFGNEIGNTNSGNTGTLAITSSSDENAIRSHNGTATVTNVYDVNKDGFVNSSDENVAHSNGHTESFIKITAPATIGSLVVPETLTPGHLVTIQAGDVTDPSGTMTGINFYEDANGNGIWDPGDTLIGAGTQYTSSDGDTSTGVWTLTVDPANLDSDTTGILAVPVNSHGEYGLSVIAPVTIVGSGVGGSPSAEIASAMRDVTAEPASDGDPPPFQGGAQFVFAPPANSTNVGTVAGEETDAEAGGNSGGTNFAHSDLAYPGTSSASSATGYTHEVSTIDDEPGYAISQSHALTTGAASDGQVAEVSGQVLGSSVATVMGNIDEGDEEGIDVANASGEMSGSVGSTGTYVVSGSVYSEATSPIGTPVTVGINTSAYAAVHADFVQYHVDSDAKAEWVIQVIDYGGGGSAYSSPVYDAMGSAEDSLDDQHNESFINVGKFQARVGDVISIYIDVSQDGNVDAQGLEGTIDDGQTNGAFTAAALAAVKTAMYLN